MGGLLSGVIQLLSLRTCIYFIEVVRGSFLRLFVFSNLICIIIEFIN